MATADVPKLERVIFSRRRDQQVDVDSAEPVWLVIRGVRQRLGQSQYTLAERLVELSGNDGLTRDQVARWERGKRIPGPYWRRWLSLVLRIPLAVLDAAAQRGREIRAARRTGQRLLDRRRRAGTPCGVRRSTSRRRRADDRRPRRVPLTCPAQRRMARVAGYVAGGP